MIDEQLSGLRRKVRSDKDHTTAVEAYTLAERVSDKKALLEIGDLYWEIGASPKQVRATMPEYVKEAIEIVHVLARDVLYNRATEQRMQTETRQSLYRLLISRAIVQGDFKEVNHILTYASCYPEIDRFELRSEAAMKLAGCGQVEEALRINSELTFIQPDISYETELYNYLHRLRIQERVSEGSLQGVDGSRGSSDDLIVVEALAEQGKIQEAENIISKKPNASRHQLRVGMKMSYIDYLSKTNLEELKRYLDENNSTLYRRHVQDAAILALLKRGKFEEAGYIAQQIVDRKRRVPAERKVRLLKGMVAKEPHIDQDNMTADFGIASKLLVLSGNRDVSVGFAEAINRPERILVCRSIANAFFDDVFPIRVGDF